MHERPAGARSPQATHSLSLVRVPPGDLPGGIEPRYCVGSNPTLDLQRTNGGGGIRTHDTSHPV